jgi:hypothetical protein
MTQSCLGITSTPGSGRTVGPKIFRIYFFIAHKLSDSVSTDVSPCSIANLRLFALP